MSSHYNLELSCGCLVDTELQRLQPCRSDNCKADEEYFDKYTDGVVNDSVCEE